MKQISSEDLKKTLEKMEEEIREKQKITDHQIREYPIEVIFNKFTDGLEEDRAELYIPDYQREYVWTEKQKSTFIESLLLNLPIPYLFVADTNEHNDGRIEIVDGTQRIRTIVAFLNNEFQLKDLKKIPSANGTRFKDWDKPRQLRFKRKTLRMIELTEAADEEARRMIFERLNSGGTLLNDMEMRFGSKTNKFYQFLKKQTDLFAPKNEESLFKQLCPISETRRKRAEYEELLFRFFAYANNYQNFDHQVNEFLEKYAENVTENDYEQLSQDFKNMLNYIEKTFGKKGFRKTENGKSIPRIRFEALSVGVLLALRENPDLSTKQDLSWADEKPFTDYMRSDASNNKKKVIQRIEYVRDKLLGKEV